jgi:hypothetical protein
MQGKERAKYADEDWDFKGNTTLGNREKTCFDIKQKVIIKDIDEMIEKFDIKVHLWMTIEVSY